MKGCAADVCHLHLVRTELVCGLVDSICDAEQRVEEGHEGGFVWLDHQEDWQARLVI